MHGPLSLLQVCLVLLQIPFLLAIHVAINILRYLAPHTTFKLAIKILQNLEVDSWLNRDKIEGVEDLRFMFSLDIMKWKVESSIRDILKPAKLGQVAPNPQMVSLSTNSLTSLLSKAKPGIPLVLNFGSCT